MADSPTDSSPLTLEVWTVATFDVVAFGLVLVLVGHLTGALADALPGFGTLPGVAVFGYLWVLVVLGTRWALADGRLDRETGLTDLLSRGAIAGGFVGGGFVLGLVLVGGLTAALTGGFPLVTLGIVAGAGTLVGGVVGSVVGAAFVLLNLALLRLVDLAVPPQ